MNKLRTGVQAGVAWVVSVALPVCVVAVLWQLSRTDEAGEAEDAHVQLLEAIETDDGAKLDRRLARGLPVDARAEKSGFTPLIWAAGLGRTRTAERLLANGADVNATARGVGTPLASAAWGRKPAMVRLLLAQGADPDGVPGDVAISPLAAAALAGDLASAELLLAAGADVNGRDPTGQTALAIAERNGDEAMCRLLAGFGAAQACDASQESRTSGSCEGDRRGW